MSWTGLLNLLFLLATIAVGVVAGLPISPYFDPTLFSLHKLTGRALPGDHAVYWYGSTLLIALVTVAVAYLPAALVKWLSPRTAALLLSRMIWLAAATTVAWPVLRILVDVDE